MKQQIVIVGGGAAGVSMMAQLVDSLIKQHMHDITIYLVEKNTVIGPGLPYSTREKDHILNLNASIMSPFPDQPEAFSQWLTQFPEKWSSNYSEHDVLGNPFPPRYLYGLYLRDLAFQVVEKASIHHIRIQMTTGVEVIDLADSGKNKLFITLSDNQRLLADQVILCVGHLPSSLYRQFKQYPRYIDSPWNAAYKQIAPGDPVILIGSRLTAIDAALALVANGHRGKIHLASRSGLLPTVLGPITPYQRQVLTLEKLHELSLKGERLLSLEEVLRLFWLELELATGKPINLTVFPDPALSAEQWLSNEITAAEAGPRGWQCVLMSVYTIIPEIWQLLKQQDKGIFLDYFYGLFITYLAAFPPQNARKILCLLQSGQLEVHAGLHAINYDHTTQCYHAVFNTDTISAPWVMNATGPGYEVTHSDSQLFEAMLNRGIICPHELGGIQLDFRTLRVKDTHGKTSLPIFAVGELTRGEYLVTTDLGQTAKQVKQVVYQVIKGMQVAASAQLQSQFFSPQFQSASTKSETGEGLVLPKAKL